MEGLSAKVFRTHNASVCLQEELSNTKGRKLPNVKGLVDITDETSVFEKKYFYDQCNKQVAILCNHKRTVNEESFDKSSAKMDEKIKKAEDAVKLLERRVKIASGSRKPKTKDDNAYVNKD